MTTIISIDGLPEPSKVARYRRYAMWQSLATDNRYVIEIDEIGRITGVIAWENRMDLPPDPRKLPFCRKQSLLDYVGNKPGLQMILQSPNP